LVQFGVVFLVEQTQAKGDIVLRAVKSLRPGASNPEHYDFLQEAEALQSLDHPNIVRLHGVCMADKPWLIVEDFVRYGDLDNVLRTCKAKVGAAGGAVVTI